MFNVKGRDKMASSRYFIPSRSLHHHEQVKSLVATHGDVNTPHSHFPFKEIISHDNMLFLYLYSFIFFFKSRPADSVENPVSGSCTRVVSSSSFIPSFFILLPISLLPVSFPDSPLSFIVSVSPFSGSQSCVGLL